MDKHHLELHQKRIARIDAELKSVTNDRERFLLNRQKGLGGSDMAKILGQTKYGSKYSVWLNKSGRETKESTSLAAEVGTWCEELIARKYAEITGFKVRNVNAICSKKYPFLLANFDRLVLDDKGTIIGGLECKTTGTNFQVLDLNGNLRPKWGAGNVYDNTELLKIDSDIDPTYYAQVQHYLAVSQLEWWDVAVLISNTDLRIFRIYPDRDFIANMIDVAQEFWCTCVLDDIAPPKDMAHLKAEAVSDDAIDADVELISLLTDYNELNAEYKRLEKDIDAKKEAIAQIMQDAPKAVYLDATGKEKTACTFKGSNRTSFDSKALELAEPEIYKRYLVTKPTERALRVYWKS